MAVDRTAEVAASAAAAVIMSSTPLLGDWTVIILAAVGGAFVNVSRTRQLFDSRTDGLFTMARGVIISAAATWSLTFIMSIVAQSKWEMAGEFYPALLLPPIAFGIAFVGDGWFSVKRMLLGWVADRVKSWVTPR